MAELFSNYRPVILRHEFGRCPLVTASQFSVTHQHDDRIRKFSGGVRENHIPSMVHIEAFRPDRSAYDRSARRHCLVDFEPSATGYAQRNDHNRCLL